MNLQRPRFLLLSIIVIASITIIPATAYAAGTGIVSSIISDEVVLLSVMITLIGVGLKAVIAVLRHGRQVYDFRMTAVSLILGFLVSLQLVSTSIENLPAEAASTTYLIIIIGEILTVMGVDSGAKSVGQKLGLTKPPTAPAPPTTPASPNGGTE